MSAPSECLTPRCPCRAEPGEDYCSKCRFLAEQAQDDADGDYADEEDGE